MTSIRPKKNIRNKRKFDLLKLQSRDSLPRVHRGRNVRQLHPRLSRLFEIIILLRTKIFTNLLVSMVL